MQPTSIIPDDLQARADRAVAGTIARGAAAYRRERDLEKLILTTSLPATEPARTRVIVQRLEDRLEAQKNLARSGHWSACFATVTALRQAIAAETAMLHGRAA